MRTSKAESKEAVRFQKLAWLVSIVLYALCWVLPILDDNIGYDGARVAHESIWKLVTQGQAIEKPSDVFEIVFVAVGWLANELYLIGIVVVLVRPHIAARMFAFALGIMISWQLGLLNDFPLLVGYWFWVVAGGMALWLAAWQWAEDAGRPVARVLAEPITAALFLFPVLNASMGLAVGIFE